MPPLKEIKTRIGSVKGTLKITSAMKLVAAAKLHKAQQAVATMLPYQQALYRMLGTVSGGAALSSNPSGLDLSRHSGLDPESSSPSPRIAILAVSSNSSLCGGFNANAVRKVLETLTEYHDAGIPDENITVIPIGRKMADALRRIGRAPGDTLGPLDLGMTEDVDLDKTLLSSRLEPEGRKERISLHQLIDHPSFSLSAAFADQIIALFQDSRFDRVELIYNHFVSTASQVPTREVWLPFTVRGEEIPSPAAQVRNDSEEDRLWILEPSREELLEDLLPKLMRLKIYTMLLDSAAAEHAARTVAMQTATDNGEDILDDLTLEYNKGRQQKITSELLDIIGGSMQG
jgi:F-type H+-transporting ATPase subunit gamma